MHDKIITEEFQIGQLVTVKSETHGIKEKCLLPENWDKTIRPWDNVKIPKDTIGFVVGFLGSWHTCMVIVCWGGTLEGQNLAIHGNRLIKAQVPEK
jgi:hypothetical protein